MKRKGCFYCYSIVQPFHWDLSTHEPVLELVTLAGYLAVVAICCKMRLRVIMGHTASEDREYQGG
jgi:hypothetical protein